MRKILYFIFSFIAIAGINAQQPDQTEALKLFNEGKYAEALPKYKKLLEKNNRDYNYNYYYGVALCKLNQNRSEALQRLKLAATRPPSQDVNYYLGYLYQREYEVQLAIEHYNKYLKAQKTENELTKAAKKAIAECNSAEQLINKHFAVRAIAKDTVSIDEISSLYSLSIDAGQLLRAGDFFRVGVSAEQVVFRTERGNEVYFPLMSSPGNYDLYKIVKLLDSWADAERLAGEVNSDYNELYPFLLTDGTTFYFSSDRPGGMGGLDIYQSYFDPSTGTFSEPANLGPPFNSPDDDFFLVPDIYSGKAWFTTNRGVEQGKYVVVELLWDNSVVRNLSRDLNEVKKAALLPLDEAAGRKTGTTIQTSRAYQNEDQFNFFVNDSLVYSRFEHFQSREALEIFRTGYKISIRQDSLQQLMSQKRRLYSQSYDKNELEQLVQAIVELEKETYGLEDEINGYYQRARKVENDYILQLRRNGQYKPKSSIINKVAIEESEFQKLLAEIAGYKLTFYSDNEFMKKKELRDGLYKAFFNTGQIAELQRADSLIVWGNILSLESARLLEMSRKAGTQTISIRDRVSGNAEDMIQSQMDSLVQQSRDFKRLSLQLYEKALDYKYKNYYEKAIAIGSTSSSPGSEDLASHARTRFNEAEQSLKQLTVYNPEQTERLLALKKNSVDMLEESLEIQYAGAEAPAIPAQVPITGQGTRFIEPGTRTPSYPAIHKGEDAESPSSEAPQHPTDATQQKNASNLPKLPERNATTATATTPVTTATPVSQATQSSVVPGTFVTAYKDKPEYRIQIGVFRNTPNAAAVDKIPPVTSVDVEGSDAKKYFTGSWSNYETAKESVNGIREAGFPGAFVVAFLNGKQISLEEARKME